MGSGMRKKKPAKSEVIGAIEELLEEYQETGELPELITPGIPLEILEQMEQEAAQAAQAEADRAAAALSPSAKQKRGTTLSERAEQLTEDQQLYDDLGLLSGVSSASPLTAAAPSPTVDGRKLAPIVDDDDFDDDVSLLDDDEDLGDRDVDDEEEGGLEGDDDGLAALNVVLDDDEDLGLDDIDDDLSSLLFGDVQVSSDSVIEVL